MINDRVGLAVMRLQPLHKGHCRIINHMIQECGIAVICLGSAQKSREKHDPWTVEERIQMIRNVYGSFDNKGEYLGCRIKIVPLADLNASTPRQWVSYIFEKLNKLGMAEPTDYYTGSVADAYWYKDSFWHDKLHLEDKIELDDEYRLPGAEYRSVGEPCRILHLSDRTDNPIPAASDIRAYLSLRTNEWGQWIPAVNHELIGSTYPEEFKIPEND